MKRIWILMLATVMLLAVLVGCSNNNTTDPTKPSTPTEPSVTTPTTGEDPTTPTEPTNPTTPTEPTTPDVTEPTEPSIPTTPTEPTTPTTPTQPSQPDTEPTEPTEPEITIPPEPDIVKPEIPEQDGVLYVAGLGKDIYAGWKYIQTNPAEYLGKQATITGEYKVIDGKHYVEMVTPDRYYTILVEIVFLDGWFTMPENIALNLCEGCQIFVLGEISTKNSEVYMNNVDLAVIARPEN